MDIRELSDRREIDDVLYGYARALDAHDWELLRRVFTDDGSVDYSRLEGGDVFRGGDAIVGAATLLSGLDSSQHMIATPWAAVDGDTATAQCYFQAQHVIVGTPGGNHWTLGGTYVDRLVRTPTGWRIQERDLVPTWTAGNPEVMTAAAARLQSTA